jgi:sec-independent protein translocase protein TatA
MFGLKPSELLILLVIALLLFGGTKVAALGSGLGQAIRNFKKGMSGEDEAPAKPALQTASSVDANAAARSAANVNKDA